MTLVHERLNGCNADSLDAYLRGVGFFLLAGRLEPSVRAWWDEEGILNFHSVGLEQLARAITATIRAGDDRIRPILTPWRGSEGRGRSFIDLRNAADESALDWFDACALPRTGAPDERQARAQRSDRENNPLLGQGGGFGRSKVSAAFTDALTKLRGKKVDEGESACALAWTLRGETLSTDVAKRLSVTKAVLGAYQSGRATGPGLSSRDVEPTKQNSRTNAWDLLLVVEGLRAFRGTSTRRADTRARVQGSFPLVTRARAIGVAHGEAVELREDPPDTFEFLAPLWSQPCSVATLRHLLSTTRLRTRRGVAQDTLDAVLVQAARAAHGIGFDRLVRFAFVPGSDPRYRYAVRRGSVRARALGAAGTALDEVVPFLRRVERAVREDRRGRATRDEPPGFRIVRRRLEDALAMLGVDAPTNRRRSVARQAQDVLIALALFQMSAARTRVEVQAPRLSARWFAYCDDGTAEFRLARALVGGLTVDRTSLLRSVLLAQSQKEDRWIVDGDGCPPDLEHIADPLGILVRLALLAIRRRDPNVSGMRFGAPGWDDVALLLSGQLGHEVERRISLLTTALAGVHASESALPSRKVEPDPWGIGADAARLMLAAQAADHDELNDMAWIDRTERLASLVLAGRHEMARVVADRELRRRGLDLLPRPPTGSPPPSHKSRLALALLLPLTSEQRRNLAGTACVTSVPVLQGGQA